MNILIEYANFVTKDEKQINVLVYNTDEHKTIIEVEGHPAFEFTQEFDTVEAGLRSFDHVVEVVSQDMNTKAYGVDNPYWYKKWEWIRVDDQGFPITTYLQTTEFECGQRSYKFMFNDDGSLAKYPVLIGKHFVLDFTGVVIIYELANDKIKAKQSNTFTKLFLTHRAHGLRHAMKGHIMHNLIVGDKVIEHQPLVNCHDVCETIANDLVTFDSLFAMFKSLCAIIKN